MSLNQRRWSEDFRRVSTLDATEPLFSVKGAIDYLYAPYRGGHERLDQIVELCEEESFVKRESRDPGSPMNNASAYDEHYEFLDGGLSIHSGNYFFQERGAYIKGFLVLRWLLHRLGYAQPRKLKGEEHVPSGEELERLAAEDSAKHLSSAQKYVVFCVDGKDYGQPGYIFFTHEADVMTISIAGEVESGKLTPSEARELLEPYREVLPPLFGDAQRMVFDPDRQDWDDPDSFPSAEDVQQSPQASQIFWYEADELGIEGVTLVWSEPFPELDAVSAEALEELREALSDEYEIVIKKDIDEIDSMGKSVEWARKLIEEAEEIASPRALPRQTTAAFGDLVYGDAGRGLVFLEENYIVELKRFREALRSATTWGELRNMVSEERYKEAIRVWKRHELRRLTDEKRANEEMEAFPPNLDDNFDARSLPGYADGEWPEFAPTVMGRWVDDKIIDDYGWRLPTRDGYHPVIDFDSEEKVASLLEGQGYTCTRDDPLIWRTVWGV